MFGNSKKNLHRFRIKIVYTAILFFYLLPVCKSQKEINFGLTAGCVVSCGTHVNQHGVFIRTYYVYEEFQWNNDARLSFYLRNIGPKKPHPEFQISTGLLIGYGKKKNPEYIFINKTSNQTKYNNSVAYAFNAYFNNIKTSQQTGTIALQWNYFYLNLENDLFAKSRLDRFRTGAIQVAYQKQNYRFAISQVMWTGKLGNPVYDSLYPFKNGYLDTTNSVYPFLSHGLLYASAEYVEPIYSQQMRGGIGVDAEQIRHAVQNRFMHDELFLPKKWRDKNNHHFPMIDVKGQQYLFKPEQKVRKPKVFFNTFLNPDVIE